MENPIVSVIIPTYNRADLIRRSIESMLNQTNQNFEVLIVDDASSDNTEDVVKGYNNEKIRYFRLEKNSGQCVSRNYALQFARGEYIGFLDSDDEWLPEKIEKQLDVFRQSTDPRLGAVYCGFIEKDEVLNRTITINKGNRRGDLYKDLLYGYCPSTPTMFIVKKEALLKVRGFDEGLPTFVDFDLWLRIAKSGYTFDFVEEPLIVKYEHAGEQIAKNPEKRLKGLEIFISKWGEEMKKVAGIKKYNEFKKKKLESLAMSIINNPGKDIRPAMKSALIILKKGSSTKIRLYVKAIINFLRG